MLPTFFCEPSSQITTTPQVKKQARYAHYVAFNDSKPVPVFVAVSATTVLGSAQPILQQWRTHSWWHLLQCTWAWSNDSSTCAVRGILSSTHRRCLFSFSRHHNYSLQWHKQCLLDHVHIPFTQNCVQGYRCVYICSTF